MAQPPLTFLERRWASGYSGSNSLVKAATQTTERQQIDLLDKDTHRNISVFGRRTLQSFGRFLYANCPPIKASIDEMARLAVSTYIAQFYGKDKGWGKKAEEFLYESDKFLDVRGWPYTRQTYLKNLIKETAQDGDQGTLMVEEEMTAKVQVWRSHRIGSRQGIGVVQGGPYDGAVIIDGVVLNEVGRPIAYALQDDMWNMPFAYVAARNFMLNFIPSASDAIRGYSLLGAAAFPMIDWSESKAWMLLAQKISATMAIQVNNETGHADRTKQMLTAPTTAAAASGDAQALPTELMKPGRVMYFKAGSGQKVEAIEQNQPGQNAQMFQEETLRECLQSMGWSFDFAHNPTKAGGAQMRIVIEKVESRLQEIRDDLVAPVCRRLDAWRIAKAIKAGFLPENDEWFKWAYQGPAKLTADRKYDSEIDLEETARGLMTDQKAAARRGDWYEETYAQKEVETALKWEAAKRLKESYGITIQEAYDSLWKPNPNAPAPAKEPEKTGGAGERETATATE